MKFLIFNQQGPFIFNLNNMDASVYGSQGQQRSIALAVKLGLADYIKKINEKIAIIDDKQDQINYLRTLINDYKEQVKSNSDNLELQLKKISKTYENLLSQKDSIIEKQDKTIEEMIESAKQIAKDNKATITSLEMQIGNYRELLKKYE